MAVAEAVRRMSNRPRAVPGGRPPDEVDRRGRQVYSPQQRKEPADEVRAVPGKAIRQPPGVRGRSLAGRTAVLEAPERRGLAGRARGGAPRGWDDADGTR